MQDSNIFSYEDYPTPNQAAVSEPILSCIQKLLCYALPGSRGRQRFSIFFQDFNPFIDNLTKLCIHLRFIGPVATRTNNAWALAHKTLIFIGPSTIFI
jgi:hypothetical protein